MVNPAWLVLNVMPPIIMKTVEPLVRTELQCIFSLLSHIHLLFMVDKERYQYTGMRPLGTVQSPASFNDFFHSTLQTILVPFTFAGSCSWHCSYLSVSLVAFCVLDYLTFEDTPICFSSPWTESAGTTTTQVSF
jgi:hypothetical protein